MRANRKILIVDDDPNLRKTLSDILKVKGYTPISVAQGKTALDRVKNEEPAVALIDIRLTDMSGQEVMKGIKKISARTECIVITGHASQDSAIEAVNLGAYSYVLKPCNMDQLLLVIHRAIEKRDAEEAFSKLSRYNELLLSSVGEGIIGLDMEGNITFSNPVSSIMLGWKPEEIEGKSLHCLAHGACPEEAQHPLDECPLHASTKNGETRHVDNEYFWDRGGNNFPVEYTTTPIRDEERKIIGAVLTFKDITDTRRLEEQLNHAMKMEAVGRLAGGIAHDFNNLLMVILGNTEMAMMSVDPNDPLTVELKEIEDAANRAADLIRQLLAFSRRQILDPRTLNLNHIIENLGKMLRRIIGENIELVTVLARYLGRVKIDPGQFEQIIVNLAVNARDAMPKGGKLIIETSRAELDESYVHEHPTVVPGRYVLVKISDTGIGMTDEVKVRIFDPFFTTKEAGKGTGLGLATVYGFVKQSGGYIWVYSENDRGTIFKIYLPMVSEAAEGFSSKVETRELPTGTETILVVEDDDSVRQLTCRILERQGYSVIEARGGMAALSICQQMDQPVDLVVTDVVMPGLGGVDLVVHLEIIFPDLKILYMSGYTANNVVHNGSLKPDMPYLEKPFRSGELARKVREVLDS